MHADSWLLHILALSVLVFAIARPAAAAEFSFEVRPIEVPLTSSLAEMLTAPGCVETASEETLQIAWKNGRLRTLAGDSVPMALTLELVPSMSIPVDPTVQTLLAGVSGELRLGDEETARVWLIRQENYSVQLAKTTYWPDGRVVASLPVSMSEAGETAFGHLAVFCSYEDGDALSCDGVELMFSEAVATRRGSARTLEQVLSDI